MSGFYYFLPHLTQREVVETNRFRPELLAARGLGDVLRDVKLWPADCTISEGKGPEGLPGLVIYPVPARGLDDVPVQFDARQTWQPIDDGADRWIGWLTDAPPTPEELARKAGLIDGYPIKDDHGRPWIIPVARAQQRPYGRLPQDLTFARDGSSSGRVKPQHQWLWDLAGEVWDCFNYRRWKRARDAAETPSSERPRDLPDVDPPPGDAHDDAWLRKQSLALLGVNYRVGYAEVNALLSADAAVIDDRFVQLACAALIDFDFVRELQKKTTGDDPAPAGCASPPGGAGESPTPPVTPS